MNIIEIQDSLKDLPDNALMQEMQMPTGSAPQFLVLSELKRRKRMRDEYQRRQNADMKTVAEEAISAAGMPQEGIMQMSQAMNPNSSIAQNTGMDTAMPMEPTQAPQPEQPMMMADGGKMLSELFEFNKDRGSRIGRKGGGDAINAYLRNELDPSSAEYRQIADLESRIGIDALRELSSQVVNPYGRSPSRREMRERTFFADPSMSQEESMATRRRLSGGEGIGSVSTNVEDFVASAPASVSFDTNYTGQGGTLPADLIPMQSVLATDPVTQLMAQRSNISVDDYISQMSPEARAQNLLRVSGQGSRFDKEADDAAYEEFSTTPSIYRPEVGMPTQEDLNLKAEEPSAPQVFPNDISVFEMDKIFNDEQDRRAAEAARMMNINKVPTDSPTFTGDVVPYLAGVSGDLLSATARGTGIARDAENDLNNPMVSMISSALEGQTGTEQMADFLEQENFRMMTPEDRLAQLGFRPITNVEGNQRFVNDAGRVVELQGEKVVELSGGEAMSAIDIAQRQGEDFSKSPVGNIPFGTYETDESGMVLPDTFAPLSLPIGDIESPKALENILGPESVIGELLDTESASEEQIETVKDLQDYKLRVDEESGDLLSAALPEGSTEFSFGKLISQDTSTAPAGKKSTTTSGGTGGTGGGVGGRIAKMLADREKSAEADKWLSLAQAGMALMASESPTFGGALGEAGLVGIGAMQKARKQYDADIMDLLTLQQRANAASSRGSGGLTASNMITLVRNLQDYKGDIEKRISDVNSMENFDSPEKKAADLKRLQAELMRTDFQIATYMGALGGGMGGQSFDVRGGSTQQPSVGYSLGTASQ